MFIVIIISPVILFSGITGKIGGIVTDQETGQPLVGVNIILEGTSLGAATDVSGFYTILNVPPGYYDIRASMIGYRIVINKGVQVMVDLTTEVNFGLTTEVIEGEEVIVVAKAPIVQMDVTSTSFRVSSDQIEKLQVVELNEIIELQAGVIEGHFRGGRSGEVLYIVDGIPMNDSYSGEIPFAVESDIVQEVEVISGTFNAEYGQAMSGIVNIITKEGQDYYSGEASFYVGDYVSNHDDIFLNINDVSPLAINNTQINLSGPIPFFKNDITFFILGRIYSSDGWTYGQRIFIPSDFSDFSDPENPVIESSGDSSYVPMNPTNRKTIQGKISFKISQKDKINLSSLYEINDFREYDHIFKYNPDGDYKRERNSNHTSIQLTHLFNPGTFLTANYSNLFTKYAQYVYKNKYDSRYVPIEHLISTGSNGFSTGGMRMWHHLRDNTTNILKIDLTSQFTKNHKVGAGVSYKRCKLWLHEYQLYFDKDHNLKIPSDSSWYNNSYTYYPMEISGYIQDKIEAGDMIINAGVRYDYFDSDGVVPVQFYNTRDAEKREAKSYYQISPRFGIAYPITDQGVIHFSYGHFFQLPSYEYLYINPDFEVSLVQLTGDQPPRGRFNLMGNAELKPQKTVSYEIGLKQALTDNLSIDVTAYNKDIRDLIGQETRTDIFGGKYWRYINRDYANVKGVTIAIDQRETLGGIGFSVDYTYQIASGNASDPNDEWMNKQQDPPVEGEKKRVPLDWDQTHSLNLTATTTQRGFHFSIIGKMGSGTPYTRASARYANRITNGERKPATVTFDLNISKDYQIGKNSISPYIKIYNLLDRKNNKDVYSSSGTADYDYDMNFQSYIGIKSIEEFYIRPNYYYEPRKIIIGCSVSFSQK
jgi:outer membrane receptor protein involved in Fe transport